MVRQRTPSDCGVSALAILAADRAARRIDPTMRGLGGLYNRELIAAAQVLGLTLRTRRKFDLDRENGILRLRWNSGARRRANPEGHFVAAIDGSLVCPSESIALPWRDYILTYDARACTLLQVVA